MRPVFRNIGGGRLCDRVASLARDLALIAIVALPVVVLVESARWSDPPAQEVFFAAAQNGDVEAVDSMLWHGAKADQKDDVGLTALMIASRAGRAAVVERLIKGGVNINEIHPTFGTALMQAALYGHEHVVKMLLDHHANPNLHIPQGQNALAFALMSDSASDEILDLLIDAGAKLPQVSAAQARADSQFCRP